MIAIKNGMDFSKKLEEENKLIVFVFHNWSMYSIVAKNIIEDWKNAKNRNIYLIDASEMNGESFIFKWLEDQRLARDQKIHGYGEIFWIQRTKVIEFESINQYYNFRILEEKTIELFEN